MTTPSSPNTPNAPVHPVDSFSENLQLFWLKNQNAILLGCTIVLLGILGRGGYQFYVEQREASIARAYAFAGSAPEKLKQFAVEHDGHALAGAAYLRVADEAYTAGKFDEAKTNYDKAILSCKGTPFASRAQMGAAMSMILAGKSTEGEKALKKIVDDTTQFKGLRAQACFQLTSLAAQEGRVEDIKKYTDLLLQIDASSSWAQFALMQRAAMPTESETKAATQGAVIKLDGK